MQIVGIYLKNFSFQKPGVSPRNEDLQQANT